MKACKNCGLSIGDAATFCPVCCTLVDLDDAAPAASPVAAPSGAKDPEAEAHACEKSDPSRAAALYRQAIVDYLDSDEDPLDDPAVRRDVQRVFERLSLVLKRSGLIEEALEEIDAASYLGLVDDETCGTKARRTALAKRRDALRRAVTESAIGNS